LARGDGYAAGGVAEVEVGAAFICLPVAVAISPNHNIRVSIPVYITHTGD
jgi:hypothetical protein